MIHRSFLVQSFVQPAYAYTRRTCVAAATTILREYHRNQEADGISIWTHSAFCITAAIVLCLELMHTPEPEGPTALSYREMISSTRDALQCRTMDLVASHGQTLFHWADGASVHGTLQLGQPANTPCVPVPWPRPPRCPDAPSWCTVATSAARGTLA